MLYYENTIRGVCVMKFQKMFTSMLLGVSLFGFSSFANAGVMDEIKAQYPNAIVQNKKIVTSAGKEYAKKTMPIYASIFSKESNAIIGVVLASMKGKNFVTLEFMRRGDNCIFMDMVQFRDGEGVFQLAASGEPKRERRNGKVDEAFMVIPTSKNLEIIKNAKAIKVYGHSGKTELDISGNTYPMNITFYQAIEYAIRHLSENNQ